jgi:hypothetical protein
MSTAREQELVSLVAVLSANGTFRARSLNVKSSDAPVSSQQTWDIIKSKLIADSVSKDFSKLLNDLLFPSSYDDAIKVLRSLISPLANATGKTARIVACLPDGTVYFDSNRTDGTMATNSNTFVNAGAKTINENHNTRACIMNVQLLQDSFSFESKISTSTKKEEDYVAMRVGPQGANDGTIRYSVY